MGRTTEVRHSIKMQMTPELEGHQQDLHAGQNQSTGVEEEVVIYEDELKLHAAATRTGPADVHMPCDQTDQPIELQFVHRHQQH